MSTFLKNAESILVFVIVAIILWVGKTTYDNSIVLATVASSMGAIIERIDGDNKVTGKELNRIDGHLDTIWPRLREVKERIQNLEHYHKDDDKSQGSWKY